MPRYVASSRKGGRRPASRGRSVVRRRRRQRGGSFWSAIRSFGSSANRWLKRNKALSKAGAIGSTLGIPYVGTAGKMAALAGYGKGKRKRKCVRYCRRQRGKGISPGGGALKLAGAGRCCSSKKRNRMKGPIGY